MIYIKDIKNKEVIERVYTLNEAFDKLKVLGSGIIEIL